MSAGPPPPTEPVTPPETGTDRGSKPWAFIRGNNLAVALSVLALLGLLVGTPTAGLIAGAKAAAAVAAFSVVVGSWAALRWLEPVASQPATGHRAKGRARAFKIALWTLAFTVVLGLVWAVLHLEFAETFRDWALDNDFGALLIAYSNGLGLFAGIFAYSAIGALVMLWRTKPDSHWRRGPVVLGLCGIAFLVGLATVTSGGLGGGIAVGLLALSLLAGPVGIALSSEDMLRRLAPNNRPWLLTGCIMGGLVVVGFVMLSVGADVVDAVPGRAILAAAAGLVLLVWALVSRTQADTVVVAGACAAMLWFAPSVADPPDDPNPESGPVMVALGDSYMSGEGAEEFYRHTDAADVNECRRAPTAYAELFADKHKDSFPGGLVSFACSGARTAHLTKVPQYEGEPVGNLGGDGETQLAQLNDLLESGVEVGLILLSIGGNDSGFATVGITCVAAGDCGLKEERDQLWQIHNMSQVRLALREVYAELGGIAAERGIPVVTVPYPSPINETKENCTEVLLSQREIDFLNSFVERLDKVVHSESVRAKFTPADDMRWALKNHERRLCDTENWRDAGINFIGLQSMTGSPEQMFNPANMVHSSFHPDANGHRAMYEQFDAWWQRNAPLKAVDDIDPDLVDPDLDAVLDVEPQCAMDVIGDQDDDRSCNDDARTWALGETRDWVLRTVWWLFAAVAGLWLFWVGVVGWFRRQRSPIG